MDISVIKRFRQFACAEHVCDALQVSSILYCTICQCIYPTY